MILSWLVFAPSTVTLSRFGKLKFPGEKGVEEFKFTTSQQHYF
jgi:hypothetical protein